jgi:glycosyltransferase involved in cell wall biosynthesis
VSGRLRVLLVLGTSGGGVGRHVRDLAASLVTDGQAITVAGPQSVQDALDLTASGARFVPVPIGERPSVTGDPRTIRTLRKLLKDCDVVHAHGVRAGALAALARGRGGPPPLVVTLHNALVADGPVAAVYAGLERIVAHRADAVLAVSPDIEHAQVALGARRVRAAVVAAPARRPLRRPPAETRAALGVLPGEQLVVSVARLAEQKGLPLLLDAAEALGAMGRQPRLVVAGDGPARPVLQQRISERHLPVELLGWRDDVPELLAAADVAVSSAVWEGQPIWLQEALLAGCPVVATDVGGTGRVVGDAAVLVPAGDPQALARGLLSVLADPVLRDGLRTRAAIRAAHLPDQSAARDAVLAEYGALLSGDPDRC